MQVPVIRQRKRIHPVFSSTVDQLSNVACSIKQRIMRMAMQVSERPNDFRLTVFGNDCIHGGAPCERRTMPVRSLPKCRRKGTGASLLDARFFGSSLASIGAFAMVSAVNEIVGGF